MPARESRGPVVAVLQSNYLPWKGYFDIIHDVDLFVFYDDVQFTKNDWRNRNLIKTAAGTQWITVPVGQDIGRRICDVTLPDSRWAEVHWKTLSQNYSRAPHFRQYRELFESVYRGRAWTHLSELNRHLIEAVSRELGIGARFDDSRAHALQGQGSERLLGLLQSVGAKRYVSGPAAREYLDQGAFERAGIEVTYKSYAGYPEYPQLHPPFEHRVSVVDVLFNLGPAAPGAIWGWRETQPAGPTP
jgi:hypothetical protein